GEIEFNRGGEHWPNVVDVGDPFLDKLDHAWTGPAGPGYAVVGYDEHDNEIGRISIYPIAPDILRISHYYPRSCDSIRIEEECADVWEITVSVAGEPGDQWADIYQTMPGAVFSQRQAALLVLVDTP